MGVRSLSTYVRERTPEALKRHKLRRCNLVVDGKNLAHVLYYECTGINPVFGGDYDKYASFVQKFFEDLARCEVRAVVVMDGGQPPGNIKLATVKERLTNQIDHCLNIRPSNQFKLKVFSCLARHVFVATLKKMGVLVLQADFEADPELAVLARKLDCAVLSNDSDFFITGTAFVLLDSINMKQVVNEVKKKNGTTQCYVSCRAFSVETFCELTRINAAHLPLLAILLGNDYLNSGVFFKFYDKLQSKHKKNHRMSNRQGTVQQVMAWLAKQRSATFPHLLAEITRLAKGTGVTTKIKTCIRNYSIMNDSNLLDCLVLLPPDPSSRTQQGDGSGVVQWQVQQEDAGHAMRTRLRLRSGQDPPRWFIVAFRYHRLSYEVSDILTQRCFFSPPQVEERHQDSAYLLATPIVRVIYTLLWQGVGAPTHSSRSTIPPAEAVKLPNTPEAEGQEQGDSDVVVEDEEQEDEEDSSEEEDQLTQKLQQCRVTAPPPTAQPSLVQVGGIKHEGHTKTKKFPLKWYVRRHGALIHRYISMQSSTKAATLPSLADLDSCSDAQKKEFFYSIFETNTDLSELGLPGDLELIMVFVVYWFKHSKLPLLPVHILAVLLCIFMFYIIDNKLGKLRTRKSFENLPEAQLQALLQDSTYPQPGASPSHLLAGISKEECLVAAEKLFPLHHMKRQVHDDHFQVATVHAFAEYQACIYFLQMLNTLLRHPFPLSSVDSLYGGTFCYNTFHSLRRKKNPVLEVADKLGLGTCLSRLFLHIFRQLTQVLGFQKCISMLNDSDNCKALKKKKRGKARETKAAVNNEGNDSDDQAASESDSEHLQHLIANYKKKNARKQFSQNNRFAGLLSDSDTDIGDDGSGGHHEEEKEAKLVKEKQVESEEQEEEEALLSYH